MRRKFIAGIVVAIALAGAAFVWHDRQQEIIEPVVDSAAIARSVKRLAKSCEVKRVSDGDTIVVRCHSEEVKIRFCGIDAPERSQPLGQASRAKLRELMAINGGRVLVTEIERDRYGRTVAEVEVVKGDKQLFVNAEMVRSGLAYHYERYSKNCPHRQAIASAESEAKSKRLGVWNGDYERPWDYRKHQRSNSL
ncbi:Thermonuclease family protein [Tumidithrix helvetica PCC 7403]|uniref:thermonuclease family protein n=1 Tax=Tumidithrix helvetica TaxID=3457545 RepID=UPI003C9D5820